MFKPILNTLLQDTRAWKRDPFTKVPQRDPIFMRNPDDIDLSDMEYNEKKRLKRKQAKL